MPKKVFDSIFRQVERDIVANYAVGQRYLTIHKIAEQFNVAYGTSAKIVSALAGFGMIETLPGSGITVKSHRPRSRLEGRKIAVIFKSPVDEPFPEAFYQGARDCAVKEGIEVCKLEVPQLHYNSIAFGDYLCGLQVDGIITVGFENSPLSFYHSMVKQVDLVADIPFEELPTLPVVATDNFRHGQEAAQRFCDSGHTEVCIISWCAADSQNCRGFMLQRLEGFHSVARKSRMEVNYIYLNAPNAEEKVARFFHRFNDKKAAFSLEFCANWYVASQFARRQIPVRNGNFMVYDATDDGYAYEGLPSVATCGPSLKKLGNGLAGKLIDKWKSGSFSEPRCTWL
jgi:DNA-binding transcriptional regulator YhcF (GntR family)